ncbi:TsaC protein (YrdC domain) required for threonylcarbamoyladenosine t(6)A37 modification in tRNA [hydrothermal vent metagenome]|uniref:L-threonylcarbamoyladenylate synthase n=1 Tax=hydrothermal vent metagenome TaxID=652676 RepID=A0A1W1DEQ3_9ZZZZ
MSFKVRLAAQYLKAGGVISHPTDTIQGLSCLPCFEHAMQRILQLKHRSANKGLILLASDVSYFTDYVDDALQLTSIKNTKVPTTYLLKANQQVSKLLTGEFNTIALRLTDNALITKLCQANNSALVSTSANTSGKKSATSVLELNVFFKQELDFIIAPQNYNNPASRIINLQTGERLR